jgi:hypothetical protein
VSRSLTQGRTRRSWKTFLGRRLVIGKALYIKMGYKRKEVEER